MNPKERSRQLMTRWYDREKDRNGDVGQSWIGGARVIERALVTGTLVDDEADEVVMLSPAISVRGLEEGQRRYDERLRGKLAQEEAHSVSDVPPEEDWMIQTDPQMVRDLFS